MRDNDSLILESLYSSILLKESSDEEYMRLAQNPEANREQLQRIADEVTGLGEIKHHVKNKVLIPFPKVAEEMYREYYKEKNNSYFSSGKYDEGELKYLVNEEGRKIESGVALRKKVASWVKSFVADKSDITDGSDLDFWGKRWGMSASQLKAFISDPVAYDDVGNVIPLSQRFDIIKR
jgi:hypothetical protein